MTSKRVSALLSLVLLVTLCGCKHLGAKKKSCSVEDVCYAMARMSEMWDGRTDVHPGYSCLVKQAKYLRAMLREYGEEVITPTPDLFAVYATGGELNLFWLEEDADVCMVVIREFWADGRTLLFRYGLSAAQRQTLLNKGCLKSLSMPLSVMSPSDSAQSSEGPCAGLSGDDVSGSGVVRATRPHKGVHILVSLVDEHGHESRSVPFLVWED